MQNKWPTQVSNPDDAAKENEVYADTCHGRVQQVRRRKRARSQTSKHHDQPKNEECESYEAEDCIQCPKQAAHTATTHFQSSNGKVRKQEAFFWNSTTSLTSIFVFKKTRRRDSFKMGNTAPECERGQFSETQFEQLKAAYESLASKDTKLIHEDLFVAGFASDGREMFARELSMFLKSACTSSSLCVCVWFRRVFEKLKDLMRVQKWRNWGTQWKRPMLQLNGLQFLKSKLQRQIIKWT